MDTMERIRRFYDRERNLKSEKQERQIKKQNSDWNEVISDEQNNIFQKLQQLNQRNNFKIQNHFKDQQKQKLLKNLQQSLKLTNLKQKSQEESKNQIQQNIDQPIDHKQSINQYQIKEERSQLFTTKDQQEFYQYLLPNSHYKRIPFCDSRVYGGRFTSLGNLYYCSSQEHIMLYDTSDPFNWKKKKKILAQEIQWTVTDMDICPNEQYLIYSTIGPIVQLLDLETLCKKCERINFNENNNNYYDRASIMSLKFSGDSREILVGTKQQEILVYDLISNRIINRVQQCHQDEINSVCYSNRNFSNIVFTGSDDGLIKVWDRRALGNNRYSGIFIGHSEGITNVSSKGDGVYLCSNSKDQMLKVWDIRKMISYDDRRKAQMPQMSGFDYRWQGYPYKYKQIKNKNDHSIFTFIGHQVLQTLIRCQFSPMHTTGQRYIYTGSSDGILHIYDQLTGDIAQKLTYKNHCARDVSWHPYFAIMASTSFEGCINVWNCQNKEEQSQEKTKEINYDQQEMSQYGYLNRRAFYRSQEEYDEEEEEQDSERSHSMTRVLFQNILMQLRGSRYQHIVDLIEQTESNQQDEQEDDENNDSEDNNIDSNMDNDYEDDFYDAIDEEMNQQDNEEEKQEEKEEEKQEEKEEEKEEENKKN